MTPTSKQLSTYMIDYAFNRHYVQIRRKKNGEWMGVPHTKILSVLTDSIEVEYRAGVFRIKALIGDEVFEQKTEILPAAKSMVKAILEDYEEP
jgi:hypothetical protein